MKKLKWIIPGAVFLLLILIAFKNVLFTPGIVGHTWDWGMPHFREQYLDKIKDNFFLWNDSMGGGKYSYFVFELLFWILVFPFSFFGAELASKIIPMSCLFGSGICMYKLCKYYRLSFFWAIMAGVFYMFSPINYSKVIAGHIPILLGYSLLPLFIMQCQKLIDKLSENKGIKFKDIFLISLLYTSQTIHPIVLTTSTIIFLIIMVWYFLFSKYRLKLIKIFISILFFVLILNSFWVVPVAMDFIENRIIGQDAGLSTSPGKKVTVESEMPLREKYLKNTQQPVYKGCIILAEQGMHTEYIWPISGKWRLLWIVFSCGICAFFFSGLFKGRISAFPRFGHYFLLALIGIILTAGYSNFISSLIYKMIKNVPPLYILFSHAPRLLILVVFSYSVVSFFVLSKIEEFFKRKIIYRAVSCVCLIVLILPFINGRIVKPLTKGSTQTLSLKINKINPEDKLVYEFFKNNPLDFRLAYIPPPMMSWPGDTDLSYEWNVMAGLSPKPEYFGFPTGSSLAYSFVENLYSTSVSPYLSKLLGIASVKYLVYPHYDFFISYRDFHSEYKSDITVEGFKDYKPIIDNNIENQDGLIKLSSNFKTVTIYENKYFLPHIYASRNDSIVFNNSTEYIPLIYTDCFDGLPAGIFINNKGELEKLESKMLAKTNRVFAILSGGLNINSFFAPTSGEYKILGKMSPKYVFRNVEEKRCTLDISLLREESEWIAIPNVVAYDFKFINSTDLVIACDFNKNGQEDEYVQLRRTGIRINIKKYPYIELDYKVENNEIQTIGIVAGLDFNRDGIVDGYIKGGYPFPSSEEFSKFTVNLYAKASILFPNKRYYDLVELYIYIRKFLGTDCSKLYKGSYLFWIRSISFVDYRQKVFARIDNTIVSNKWEPSERRAKGWYIGKREMSFFIERLGKGFIFKKGNMFLEVSKAVNGLLDLSQWENIELEYMAQPLLINKVMLMVDLEEKKDVYITDLKIKDGICNIDINIHNILKNLYPELNSFKLRKIKFWIEEKRTAEGNIEDIFYINIIRIYSLGIPEGFIFKKEVISIDGNPILCERKFGKGSKTEDFFWKNKVILSAGWHQMNQICLNDEYLNFDWIVLNSFNNSEDNKTKTEVNFTKVNPTKYIAHIKNAREPFWLVFLENFHEGWGAYVKPKTKDQKLKLRWWDRSAIWTLIKTRQMDRLGAHFQMNGYANGWWVDVNNIGTQTSRTKSDIEEIEVIIEFMPQRYYELGLIIAGFIIIGGFGFALTDTIRKKR